MLESKADVWQNVMKIFLFNFPKKKKTAEGN